MSGLTWRMIQRNTKWRDKTGTFFIERRRSSDGTPIYRTYKRTHPDTDSVLLSMLVEWLDYYDSLADAKAAAEAMA